MSLLMDRLDLVHRSLDAAGIDHAVGGAIALAVHVREPRFTADIDLNVIADPLAPQELIRALPTDVTVTTDTATQIRLHGQVRLYFEGPPVRTPLDLFLPVHQPYHQLVADRAETVSFLSTGLKVITATDLMVFKSLFARSKDWVDIETLGQEGVGDIDEASRWVLEITDDPVRVARLRAAWTHGAELNR